MLAMCPPAATTAWQMLKVAGMPTAQPGHRGADLLHDTDTLVTDDAPLGDGRDVPFEDVEVGSADGGGRDPHDGVCWRRDVRAPSLLPRLSALPMVDERLHCRTLPCISPRKSSKPETGDCGEEQTTRARLHLGRSGACSQDCEPLVVPLA